jgi:hypothetical protein
MRLRQKRCAAVDLLHGFYIMFPVGLVVLDNTEGVDPDKSYVKRSSDFDCLSESLRGLRDIDLRWCAAREKRIVWPFSGIESPQQ